MAIRVIVPPQPLLSPSDVPGTHASDDPRIVALIAAGQEEIDGPDGWLGRALGVQTLELSAYSLDGSGLRLPCPPIINVVSITYLDPAGTRQTLDASAYEVVDGVLHPAIGQRWPRMMCRDGSVQIRYQAGFDGVDFDEGGTGNLPERVKEAIILSVQYAQSVGAENLFLRSEEVEGVGTTQYTVSTVANDLIHSMIARRLSGLRIYA